MATKNSAAFAARPEAITTVYMCLPLSTLQRLDRFVANGLATSRAHAAKLALAFGLPELERRAEVMDVHTLHSRAEG